MLVQEDGTADPHKIAALPMRVVRLFFADGKEESEFGACSDYRKITLALHVHFITRLPTHSPEADKPWPFI